MTLLELAEKVGVKFSLQPPEGMCPGTWGYTESDNPNSTYVGHKTKELAAARWAKDVFGERVCKAIKSLLAENARLKKDATTIRRWRARVNTRGKDRNNASKATATNRYRRWSDQDLQLLFDASVSNSETAKKLGRTCQAVAHARIRYHHMAPEGWDFKPGPKPARVEKEE